MNNDLIERQAAIELIHGLYPSSPIMRKNRERWKEKYAQYIEVEKLLEMLPSVLPEIIRCKECKNHGKEICYFWSHFHGTINTPDDGFCHKAERRTDNANVIT